MRLRVSTRFRRCIVSSSSSSSESDAGVHAASCLSSDSESLLEQALRAAGPVDPATGLSMEQTYLQFGGGPDPQDDCCSMLDGGRGRGESSDEAASDCETLGSRDTSSSGERDDAYESSFVDEASDHSDSDASWVPEE